jgi:hypothetical protein
MGLRLWEGSRIMTDTKAPASGWSFLQAMTPSLNQCLVVIVTAIVSIGGTIATQRYAAPPTPKAAEAIPVKTIPIDPKMVAIEKRLADQAADIVAIRAEIEASKKRPKRSIVSVPATK